MVKVEEDVFKGILDEEIKLVVKIKSEIVLDERFKLLFEEVIVLEIVKSEMDFNSFFFVLKILLEVFCI